MGSSNLDLIERTDGLMKIEYTYANFDETESAFDPDCTEPNKRGLYVQIKRDAGARDPNRNANI